MNEMKLQEITFIPSKLRVARKQKFPGLSMRRVATDLLNVTPQRLSSYEIGIREPDATMLARLCVLYDVDLLQLTSISLSE